MYIIITFSYQSVGITDLLGKAELKDGNSDFFVCGKINEGSKDPKER